MKTLMMAAMTTLAMTGAAWADEIKLAVTTSFHNSGLSDVLVPAIKRDLDLEVQLLVVGTGQALKLGAAGDVDAILGFEVGPGEKLFFFGAAAHAFYAPLVRKLNRGEPVAAFAFGTIVAAMILIAIWAGKDLVRTDWAAMPAIVWITILYTAIGATMMSFLCIQFATLRLPSGKVMAYTYLTPSFVILWEAALGHGWAAGTVWLGAAASVLGLALLAWR